MPKAIEILLGVAVGGAIARGLYCATSNSSITATSTEEMRLLEGRKGLELDRVLLETISEPERLFRRVDSVKTETLLNALNEIALLYREAQRSGSPLIMAKALRHKRTCNAALDALLQSSRVQFPARASDVADDVEVLRKAVNDYVHNIQQSASLSLLEKTTLATTA